MSMFGETIRRVRKGKGLTLDQVARKVGTHKGYVSGIETGKVRPPSVNLIRKLAKALGQDEKSLVRLAWVDKAPLLIRDEAFEFLKWSERGRPPAGGGPPASPPGAL